MSCADNTTNNRPVGIAYNARNRPAGLSELTEVSVSSLAATTQITSTSAYFSTISATTYLGAAPGGVTTFVALTDVEDTSLAVPGTMLLVSPANQVTASDVGQVMQTAGYLTQFEIEVTYPNITNIPMALSSLGNDVSITSPAMSSILAWNGSFWVDTSAPYVLTTTNTVLSSTVSTHIADGTIHFTSGSLSSAYVLITTNTTLSTTVSNHLASAVHWSLATLNTNYINASGDTANANFFLSGLSATNFSATNNISVQTATPTLAAHLARKDYVDTKQPGDATLSALAGAQTAANIITYWSGVDLAASASFTAGGRLFAKAPSPANLGEMFYYNGSTIAVLENPIDTGGGAVLIWNKDTQYPNWLEPPGDSTQYYLGHQGPGTDPAWILAP